MSLGYDEFIAPIVRSVQQQHHEFILPTALAVEGLLARMSALEDAVARNSSLLTNQTNEV
jgi:hypothetical protein